MEREWSGSVKRAADIKKSVGGKSVNGRWK